MTGAQAWSTRVAEAAMPDEVELAPLLLDAYLAGGESQADLFRRPGTGQVGAFGPGGAVMVFPWVLRGLAVAAPLVTAMLAAAPKIEQVLDIVKGGFDINEAIRALKERTSEKKSDPYVLLQRTMVTLEHELSAVPLSETERERICYQVMRTLLAMPVETREVVAALEEASHGQKPDV